MSRACSNKSYALGRRSPLEIYELVQRLLRRIAYFVPGVHLARPARHRLRDVKVGSNVWISKYVNNDEVHPWRPSKAVRAKNHYIVSLSANTRLAHMPIELSLIHISSPRDGLLSRMP